MQPEQIVLIDDDPRNADTFFEQIENSSLKRSKCRWIHITRNKPNEEDLPKGDFEYLCVTSEEKLCEVLKPLPEDSIVFYDLNLDYLQSNSDKAMSSIITKTLISSAHNRNILIVVHSTDPYKHRVAELMVDEGVLAITSPKAMTGANDPEMLEIINYAKGKWDKYQSEKNRSKYSIGDYLDEIKNLKTDCHDDKEMDVSSHSDCFAAMAKLIGYDPEELKKS